MTRLARAAVLAVATLLIAASPPTAQGKKAGEEATCTRQAGKFTAGTGVSEPITLTPDLPAQTVNFGGGRGWQFIDVVLKASRPLPSSFEVSQLDLEVVRRLIRQGDTTTTISSTPLKFTEPRLNPRRDMITFTICVSGEGLGAGHYAGAVTAEGPDGIGPATMTINANAKDGTLFVITLTLAGILVLFLLVWRGATAVQADQAKEVADAVRKAPAEGETGAGVPAAVKEKAATVVGDRARWNLREDVLTNPFFWVSTVVSAAFAVAAAFTIYSQNTAWGSDPAVDAFAVGSAILAAAGFRSLLATGAGK
jgi:hypothetical protein